MNKNINRCLAIKKDNTRCTIYKTYDINYKNNIIHICGIHLNVFRRNNLRLFEENNENTKKINILNLPIEILENIFNNMKIKELFYLRLVCKRWSNIVGGYITNNFICTLIIDKNIKMRFTKYYNYDFFYEENEIKFITFDIEKYKIDKKYKIQNLEITCSYLSENLINIIRYIYCNFDIKHIYLNVFSINKKLFNDILINILNNTSNSVEIHTYEEINLEEEIDVENPKLKRLLIYNSNIYKNLDNYFPNLEILSIFPQLIYNIKKYIFKTTKVLEIVDNFDKYRNGINEDLFNSIICFLKNNNIKLIKWNIIMEKYISKLNKVSNINNILISKKYNGIKYLKKYKNVKFI